MSNDSNATNVMNRIKALKSARTKAVLENRKAVYNEANGLKKQQLARRKLNEKEEEEEELKTEKEYASGGSLKDRKSFLVSNLSYTAEEDDRWKIKQCRMKKHHEDSENGELQNYKQLAEKTYLKNMRDIEHKGLKKSIAEYENEKKSYTKLKARGLSSEEIRSKLTSKERLDNYINNFKNWEEKVYQKRQKIDDEGKDGAIHEKNRQFNSKLKRHYDSLKK